MIKIIVDVFSGDNPQDLIKGTADAVNACPDVHIKIGRASCRERV